MSESGTEAEALNQPGLSRRGLLGLVGASAATLGLGAGGAAGVAIDRGIASGVLGASSSNSYPFFGQYQSGIITPAQDRLHFAAFDISGNSRSELQELLEDWSYAANRMMAGLAASASGSGSADARSDTNLRDSYDAPPDDTGEALDLPPAGLTITFGFGPSLFDRRFGLAARRPEALIDLPHFAGDALIDTLVGGDLCIQACSDDPQVAVHAIRNLSRIAFGRASVRWSQLGFGRTSSTTRAQTTPRNLFGFKDGTANVRAEDTTEIERTVWVGADDNARGGGAASWMTGGSYLVTRTIRMTIETWDRASLREQENVVGRAKVSGAPLSGGTEFSPPDFVATGSDSTPLIAPPSHLRNAHPAQNGGASILRRGYNFVDGHDGLGRLNAGLFFICFQRDPRTQFVPIQQNLARHDSLNEYTSHVGSGIFAVPPGAREGAPIGAGLFS